MRSDVIGAIDDLGDPFDFAHLSRCDRMAAEFLSKQLHVGRIFQEKKAFGWDHSPGSDAEQCVCECLGPCDVIVVRNNRHFVWFRIELVLLQIFPHRTKGIDRRAVRFDPTDPTRIDVIILHEDFFDDATLIERRHSSIDAAECFTDIALINFPRNDRAINEAGTVHRGESFEAKICPHLGAERIHFAFPGSEVLLCTRKAASRLGGPRYVSSEAAGITVCVLDSTTHEWEGIGGVTDMAEKAEAKMGRFGKWADPKIRHKKFVYYCLSSSMTLIFCLRAADKVKMFKRGEAIITSAGQETSDAVIAEKDVAVSLGLQPICEKRFAFEMLLSLVLDEHTHCAAPIKIPEPLQPLFAGKHLITKADGERIRQWNLAAGNPVSESEQLQKRARAVAEEGMTAYVSFFGALTKKQKQILSATTHAENKQIAERADKEIPEVEKLPDAVEQVVGTQIRCGGQVWTVRDNEADGYHWEGESHD